MEVTSCFDGMSRDVLKVCPYTPTVSSWDLGWRGVLGMRFDAAPAAEVRMPQMGLHALVLITRSPDKLELNHGRITRREPPPAGTVTLLSADNTALWRWKGLKDSLHFYVAPEVMTRAVPEAAAKRAALAVPSLDSAHAPELRATMLALEGEMRRGGLGGTLMVEALTTVLAVRLLRHLSGGRLPAPPAERMLPRRKLGQVIDFIMGNLEENLTLEQMARVVHLSPYHFARQFKTATGVPPHQYVIAQRVKRAQDLMREEGAELAEIALRVGFSDQSQLSFHFKRLLGVTPGQFRLAARMA